MTVKSIILSAAHGNSQPARECIGNGVKGITNIFFLFLLIHPIILVVASETNIEGVNHPQNILSKLDHIGGGIICVSDNEIWPVALNVANNSRWIVQGLAQTSIEEQSMRMQAEKSGFLGKNVYVEAWDGVNLPQADHLLDYLFVKKDFPETEALRVISPIRGKAFIGQKMLTKPELIGSDWWTNRAHGADNNQTSEDTAFKLPAMLQFLAMPFYSSLHGSALATDGLRIEFYDWVVRYSGGGGTSSMAGKMLARSIYNGQTVWRREMPKYIKPDAPICAVSGNTIFLADGGPAKVLTFDVQTGEDLAPIQPASGDMRHITWLGVEKGKLYLLLADPDWPRVQASLNPHASFYDLKRKERQPGLANKKNPEPPPEKIISSSIVCWDIKNNRQLWRHDDPMPIEFRVIAVSEGRTYFFSDKTRLACLNEEGKLVWENNDPQWMSKLQPNRILVNANLRNSSALTIGPKTLVFSQVCGTKSKNNIGFTFDLINGKYLWERAHFESAYVAYPPDGNLWTRGTSLDALTGKSTMAKEPSEHAFGHCGHQAWVPAIGMVGNLSFMFKNPCAIPPVVGGGVLNYFPSVCNCAAQERGAAGLVDGKKYIEMAEKSPEHPILEGTSFPNQKEVKVTTETGDWPQYRGSERHLGTSQRLVPKAPILTLAEKLTHPLAVPEGHYERRWEWIDRPTAPVTSGGLAFYGLSTGLLRAVRVLDGKEVWKYWANGAILTAPAIANGRLYAGSANGWVICLDAFSGKLIWKWRAAPIQRSMMVYDKLMSSWPVVSVVTYANCVYGIAGLYEGNGSILFSLDINTGSPLWTKWQRDEDPLMMSYKSMDKRVGRTGYLAILNNDSKNDFSKIKGIYDAATGIPIEQEDRSDLLLIAPEIASMECMVINNSTILRGGLPLWDNQDIRNFKYNGTFVSSESANSKWPTATRKNDTCVRITKSIICPAIDDEIAMVGGSKNEGWGHAMGLSLWNTASWLDLEPSFISKSLNMKDAKWSIPNLSVNSLSICPDAVIATVGVQEGEWKERWPPQPFVGWRICAFARKDGGELWSIDLPCEPLYNGLATNSDGQWIVALRDGNLVFVSEKNN